MAGGSGARCPLLLDPLDRGLAAVAGAVVDDPALASQRQIVESDVSVRPRSITSRCSSVREKRPQGSPRAPGSSHASAFSSTICSGGARALAILKPSKRSSKNPLSSSAAESESHEASRGLRDPTSSSTGTLRTAPGTERLRVVPAVLPPVDMPFTGVRPHLHAV